jgi:hypothetical protein
MPLSVSVAATRATFPAVALKAMSPTASGAGKSCPQGVPPAQPEPDASLIKRYWPGESVTRGSSVACHVEPVADEY